MFRVQKLRIYTCTKQAKGHTITMPSVESMLAPVYSDGAHRKSLVPHIHSESESGNADRSGDSEEEEDEDGSADSEDDGIVDSTGDSEAAWNKSASNERRNGHNTEKKKKAAK